MMDKILKGIVVKQVIDHATKDATRYMKKRLKNFDADLALRRVGLTTYKPASIATSGVSLLLLGAAVGAVAALVLAPKPGAELRADLLRRLQREEEELPAPATGNVRREPPIARV